METLRAEGEVEVSIKEAVASRFHCQLKDRGDCEGKLHMGPFKGFYCRKHLVEKKDELGVYGPADNGGAIAKGPDDDYARRHHKSKTRKSYGGVP